MSGHFKPQPRTQSLIVLTWGDTARAGRFITFSRPKLPEPKRSPYFSQMGPSCTRFYEDIEPSSALPEFVFGFRYFYSFLNRIAADYNFGPNFALFESPCKD